MRRTALLLATRAIIGRSMLLDQTAACGTDVQCLQQRVAAAERRA
eukprot:COSAG06_NODE_58136_length_278_cov_0.569832_1_plen_44_part_10